MESKITTLQHAAIDGRPLRKGDRLRMLADRLQCQGIAQNNVVPKDVPSGSQTFFLGFLFVKPSIDRFKGILQALATSFYVVFQEINTVDRRNRQDAVSLKVMLILAVSAFYDDQFSGKDIDQEISSATRWLQESGFDPLGFLLDEIEHGVDLALIGEDLPVICNPLLGDNLFFH